MKTDNTIRVITMSFTVLQDDILFIRLVVRLEKRELSHCFKFIQHNPRHEAQREDQCDQAYKNNVSPN